MFAAVKYQSVLLIKYTIQLLNYVLSRLSSNEIHDTVLCESQIKSLAFLSELNRNPHSGTQERKNEALLQACRIGNKFLVQSLLLRSAHVECRDALGDSPLNICAAHGFVDLAWMLIRHGADVNSVNNNGDSALSLAVSKSCSTEMVHLLLQQKSVKVFHKNREGYSILMTAVVRLDFELIHMILEKMFDSGDETLYRKSVFEVHSLAKRRGIDNIFLYMEQAVSQCRPALLSAAIHGDLKGVIFLLDYGIAKIDTNSYETVLTETLTFYLERGSDVENHDLAIVEILLEHGKSLFFFRSINEKSVLAQSVHIGNTQLVELLCRYICNNASSNVAEREFKSSLKACVKVCRCDLLVVLLKYRPNLLYCNMSKLSVEHALISGKVDFLNMLWDCGITKLKAKGSMMTCIIHSQIHSLNFIMEKLRQDTEIIVKDSASGVFHKAVEVGDILVINRLMEAGADVNGMFESKTPLMCCTSCHVANYLFQQGANINQRGQVTAILNLFSVKYAAHVLKETSLLTKGFVHLNEISEVLVNRYKQLVKDLLDLFLRKGGCLEDKDIEDRTVLMLASKVEEFEDLLSYLLQCGADPENQDKVGNTALHLAVSENRMRNVDILLSFKANANAKCQFGISCLHQSVEDNNREMIQLLVSRGADVNVEDEDGNTPMGLAVSLRGTDPETLQCLSDSGADLNHRNHAGDTPLMMAASLSFTDTIQTLCRMGADVNVRNYDNTESALGIMVEKCNSYLFRDLADATHTLLEHGASADCVRAKHIMGLICKREYRLLQRLIYAGASPSELDKEQVDVLAKDLNTSQITTLSPFRFAIYTNNSALAKYFLKINFLTECDVFQRDWIGPIRQGLIKFNFLDAITVLDEFCSTPMSLETMCLIKISSAVHAGTGRESRVKSLPIPDRFKNELLFHTDLTVETEVVDADSPADNSGDDEDDLYYDDFGCDYGYDYFDSSDESSGY